MTDLEVSFDVTSGFDALEAPDKLPMIFNGDKTVIYGIFRSKAASDQPLEAGVTGTATLKGKVLGVLFEYTIPFEVPPPGSPDLDSFQMPIVHHLAAKSLIRDWEHKEGWASTASESECKEEIIRVSIESSVVSAHTAYIAIDEEYAMPIEGAIQIWDLNATMAASEGRSFGFGGGLNMRGGGGGRFFGIARAAPAGGMLLGGPPQPQSAMQCFAPFDALGGGGSLFGGPPVTSLGAPPPPPGGMLGGPPPPPAPSMMSFGAPPPPGNVDLLSGPPPPPAPSMMSFGAPPPPPPTGGVWPSFARNTSSFGAPPPPAFGAGPPPPVDNLDLFSFNSSAQAAPLKSQSVMEKGSGLGATRFQSASNELTQLISLQQAEGFWNLDKVSSFMKKTISSPISGVDSAIWATVISLVLLENRFSQQQDEWELVAMKAETWLSMQSLPAGYDVQKLKEEAKKLI